MRFVFILIISIISQVLFGQASFEKKYIFFGHCYDGYTYDSRLSQINLDQFNGRFMGGDILSESSLKIEFLDNLDSLVDLSDPMTMWALGNHDSRSGNWDWISDFTLRKTYFAHYADKSTFIVLNTNIVPYDCEPLEEQFSIIENVCDSIVVSNNLFLFMHHNIWENVPGLSPGWSIGHHNCKFWLANCDSVSNHFYNTVYPMLVEVHNRGIEVFCVFGDLGAPGKERFDEVSTDGIHFLGSGLFHYSPGDAVLIFENNNGLIDYGFHNLDSLVISN